MNNQGVFDIRIKKVGKFIRMRPDTFIVSVPFVQRKNWSQFCV